MIVKVWSYKNRVVIPADYGWKICRLDGSAVDWQPTKRLVRRAIDRLRGDLHRTQQRKKG